VDIWHATVFADGKVYDEDCAGREAAQQWVAGQLDQLGHTKALDWKCDAELCEARPREGLTALVRLRH
jgi:hypothetical protein